MKTWKHVTGIKQAKFDEGFNAAVKVLDDNQGAKSTACLLCVESPTDLTFVIDDSESINDKSVLYFFPTQSCAVFEKFDLFGF